MACQRFLGQAEYNEEGVVTMSTLITLLTGFNGGGRSGDDYRFGKAIPSGGL